MGPLSGESGKVKAVTGIPNSDDKKILVQDFSMLDKDAYGPFADGNGPRSIFPLKRTERPPRVGRLKSNTT